MNYSSTKYIYIKGQLALYAARYIKLYHAHTHTHTHRHTHTHAYTRTRTHTRKHAHTHTHEHTCICIDVCIYTHVCSCVCVCGYTHIYTNICVFMWMGVWVYICLFKKRAVRNKNGWIQMCIYVPFQEVRRNKNGNYHVLTQTHTHTHIQTILFKWTSIYLPFQRSVPYEIRPATYIYIDMYECTLPRSAP